MAIGVCKLEQSGKDEQEVGEEEIVDVALKV